MLPEKRFQEKETEALTMSLKHATWLCAREPKTRDI